MSYSIVHKKNLNVEFRLDAEYYRKEILDKFERLSKHNTNTLDQYVHFIVGPFGSTVTVDKYVEKSEYKYVRNKDIDNFKILDIEPVCISEELYNSLKAFHIQKDDLLVTVVGTLGKVAIAQQNDCKSIFSCKSTLLRSTNINPYYLLAYLNSKIGQLFLLRGKRGAIQEGLNLVDLKEVVVYEASENIQTLIEKAIKKAFSLNEYSNLIYKEAQELLLFELGLDNYEPNHILSYTRSFSEVQNADRFDAEYFQPKYDVIDEAIKSYKGGYCNLDTIVTFKKGVEVGSKEYMDEGIPFIRVSNLSPFEITKEKYISNELYNRLIEYQPKKGEIFLSKDGTPGIAHYIENEPSPMISSGGVLRLKVIDESIKPEYLTLVFNSLIMQQQIKRDVGGSIILHWRIDQIRKTLIPKLDLSKQERIVDLVNESFNKRKKATLLLDISKTTVEKAVEQDEATAISWFQSELDNLEVDLDA